MSIHRTVDTIRYATRRRWPGPRAVGGVLTIGIEAGSAPLPPDPLDAFLTARWGLYSTSAKGRLRYAPVEHPPWILHRASVLHLSDGLVAAAGYDAPDDRPHVRWSPGVPVRIGVPKTVR